MSQRILSRRRYLAGMAIALLASSLASCAPAPTSTVTQQTPPTTAPAAPTQAPTATQPSAPPTRASAPTQSAAAAQTTPAAGPVKLSDGKIVLGVINDQSGVYADIGGINGVKAVQMAADDFLAKYGKDALGGPIEVISADHQNKPDLASQKAQEFYQRNGCDMITDVPTSSCGLAVAQVAKQQKKPYINVGSATSDLTGSQCNKYTFHYTYDTWMLANGTGTTVTKNIGKKWYIVYPNYAFGQDMNKQFTAAIQKAGGTVIQSDGTPFPNTSGDFSSYLLKAAAAKPDVIGAMHAGQEVVNIVKQFNQFKLKEQTITLAIGLLFTSDIAALGPDAFAGTVFTTAWDWNMDDQSRQWADRFLKLTGKRPTYTQAGNYSATWQYLEAVRRAGTDDPDAVVKQLEGHKFEDFTMRHAMIRAEDHRVIHDVYLAQVKPQSEVKEPEDFVKILNIIPAEEAFRPVSEAIAAGCKMG
jgi:branched-chain amino acid transport system substrate-binding protein